MNNIMISAKTCSKCHETKPLDEFYKSKSGKYGRRSQCKECENKQSRKYRQEHKEELKDYDKNYHQEHREERKKYAKNYNREHKDELREKAGHISMYENKLCPQYLGIVIGERLVRHLFKDVQVMPRGNTGYDIVCNRGMKIDVKTACTTLQNRKHPYWYFNIRKNTVADFFILVAFDNLTNLNPLHLWMIPGSEINRNKSKSIRPSTIHKWDKYKKDIKDAQLCCNEMKNQ